MLGMFIVAICLFSVCKQNLHSVDNLGVDPRLYKGYGWSLFDDCSEDMSNKILVFVPWS